MANISIYHRLDDGSMGFGWVDTKGAAGVFAALLESTWTKDLARFISAGHTVAIEIEVVEKSNEVPYTGLEVTGENDDSDVLIEIEKEVDAALTSSIVIYDRFFYATRYDANL